MIEEMPWYLRGMIRCMQPMGKSTVECAEFMVDPILKSAVGETLFNRPNDDKGIFIMNQDASAGSLTKGHTSDALNSVWNTTVDVLKRAGIFVEE